MVARLHAATGAMTTAAVKALEESYPWYSQLSAEERSWITLVTKAGIEAFAQWFADEESGVDPIQIFNAAPRAMTRRLTLRQTVDLVRTTIDVVEEQIELLMPRPDRPLLTASITRYSREVAFAVAEVYARAAESRGAWEEQVEAIVIDAVMRNAADESAISRASTLGWPTGAPTVFIAGFAPPPDTVAVPLDDLRAEAKRLGLTAMCASVGRHLVAVLCGPSVIDDNLALAAATKLQHCFGPQTIVVGSVSAGLADACASADEAVSGAVCSAAWTQAPRVCPAHALLPERALAGNALARRQLVALIYQTLNDAGGDLLETCAGFLDSGASIEASARVLYVHPNTIRYRLKRIFDITGYLPSDPRDAYTLRLALTFGRLDALQRES
ncbi:MAG: helix-turn-helix domain-containing protein [Propionibacteriaceae bacterium]|nr:helix-turn-helix domain-containing protein [Propionibacteriaceae bacterium]